MLEKIHYNVKEDLKKIEKVLGQELATPVYTIGYHCNDGEFLVALTNYTPDVDIEGSCIAEGKWFDLDIYKHLFACVFDALKCKRFTFKISKDNKQSIKLAELAGCVLECELRGIDMLLYSIIPSECKYYGR